MIRKIIFTLLLILPLLLLAQDTTKVDPPGGEFDISLADWFELASVLLVWLIGVATGRWRQVFQALANIMPFLEDFVNRQDKRAILNINAVRSARLTHRNKPNDIEVKVKQISMVILLLLCASFVRAQWVEPALPAGQYSLVEAPGLGFFMADHQGDSIPISNGDTVFFDFTEPDLLAVTSAEPVVIEGWAELRAPLFAPSDFSVPYFEVRQYRTGANYIHQYHADSSISSGTDLLMPNPIEGHYYALILTDSISGRLCRFYLQTSENIGYVDTLVITRTVIDSITVTITEEIPVYVAADANAALSAIVDTSLVPVLYAQQGEVLDALAGNSEQFRGISYALGGIAENVDSLALGQQGILEAVGSVSTPVSTLNEVLISELTTLSLSDLTAKYRKTRAIEVEGHKISTCTFATFAEVSCQLTEDTIFAAAQDVAVSMNN